MKIRRALSALAVAAIAATASACVSPVSTVAGYAAAVDTPDQRYLAMAREADPALQRIPDRSLVKDGALTCRVLDTGGTFDDLVNVAADSTITSQAFAAITVAAVNVYCPRYQTQLDVYTNSR